MAITVGMVCTVAAAITVDLIGMVGVTGRAGRVIEVGARPMAGDTVMAVHTAAMYRTVAAATAAVITGQVIELRIGIGDDR